MGRQRIVQFPAKLWNDIEREAEALSLPPEIFVMTVVSQATRPQIVQVAPGDSPPKPTPRPLPANIQRSSGQTGFAGVYPNGNRFKAVLGGIILGTFDTAEEAALVRYDQKQAEREAADEAAAEIMKSAGGGAVGAPPSRDSFRRPYTGPVGKAPPGYHGRVPAAVPPSTPEPDPKTEH